MVDSPTARRRRGTRPRASECSAMSGSIGRLLSAPSRFPTHSGDVRGLFASSRQAHIRGKADAGDWGVGVSAPRTCFHALFFTRGTS